jgi:glycosyltransferase involved in cell wall biosynthesis
VNEPGAGDSVRVLVLLGNRALNGQERGSVEVFASLSEVGVRSLFATHGGWGGEVVNPHLDGLELRHAPVPYAVHFTRRLRPRGWVANLIRVHKGSRALKALIRHFRPTHIHVANPHYFLAVAPVLLATKARVIYRLGDEPTLHHAFHRLVWRRLILPRVDRFVCVSEFVRRSLIASGGDPDRAEVIYSAPPARPPAPPLALPPFAGRTVVFVGQVSPHKGVHVLLEAAVNLCSRREDLRVLIAGRAAAPWPELAGTLARLAASPFADRIRFLGYVENIPSLMEQSDLHVCPSVWDEPLSNTVPEAKRAGIPSIVFPAGGLPEVVRSGIDGYICPDRTATSLESAIEHYLDMTPGQLEGQNVAARASLKSLGMDRVSFTRAWASVYGVEIPIETDLEAASEDSPTS